MKTISFVIFFKKLLGKQTINRHQNRHTPFDLFFSISFDFSDLVIQLIYFSNSIFYFIIIQNFEYCIGYKFYLIRDFWMLYLIQLLVILCFVYFYWFSTVGLFLFSVEDLKKLFDKFEKKGSIVTSIIVSEWFRWFR